MSTTCPLAGRRMLKKLVDLWILKRTICRKNIPVIRLRENFPSNTKLQALKLLWIANGKEHRHAKEGREASCRVKFKFSRSAIIGRISLPTYLLQSVWNRKPFLGNYIHTRTCNQDLQNLQMACSICDSYSNSGRLQAPPFNEQENYVNTLDACINRDPMLIHNTVLYLYLWHKSFTLKV